MAVIVPLVGLSDYVAVHALQQALVAARIEGDVPDVILLLEHPATITVGRAQHAMHNVLDHGDIPVVPIKRGGDVTLHAPGQLVAYPIVQLEGPRRDLHRHLAALEDACIGVCADLGLVAARDPRNTGTWLPSAEGPPQKVASIGIACKRWVTWHGLALNVDIDLALFGRINPCGFGMRIMTRLADHLTDVPSSASLIPAMATQLMRTLALADSPASETARVFDWIETHAPSLTLKPSTVPA